MTDETTEKKPGCFMQTIGCLFVTIGLVIIGAGIVIGILALMS